MSLKIEVLFDAPQQEIASRIRDKMDQCTSASIVSGFVTPSGVGTLAPPIKARSGILKDFVVGAATYPGFEALDQLIAWGVPQQNIRVHLGHTRESGGKNNPFVRHHPMLHSKIYYMELPGDQACAFVGSHNVTSFALQGMNGEAAVMLLGPSASMEFVQIRNHIREASAQASPYSPGMKEAYAWWMREFLDGLRAEFGIPSDWSSVRTILIFAAASTSERPKVGSHVFFELPAGIAIDSLKTEVHLFVFSALPNDPQQALHRLSTAIMRYTCKVMGAENLQGNLELRADWQVDASPISTLRKVPSGVHRPTTAQGMQQARAEVMSQAVSKYEYLFERQRKAWMPEFDARKKVYPTGEPAERFPIQDNHWMKQSGEGWQLVSNLVQSEGPALEKDEAALARAKPESGAFILVSLRRRMT